jgi:hypothetical protein
MSTKIAAIEYAEGRPQALKKSEAAFVRDLSFLAAAKLY